MFETILKASQVRSRTWVYVEERAYRSFEIIEIERETTLKIFDALARDSGQCVMRA